MAEHFTLTLSPVGSVVEALSYKGFTFRPIVVRDKIKELL